MEENITGILLAGGKSSRIGQDKGLIKIGGKQLFEYPLQLLERLCRKVIISTCKPGGTYGQWPHLCDEYKGIGPLGGIYTCLKASSTKKNIILSYDMPLVNNELIKTLISLDEQYEIILPAKHINSPQPLCGIYKKSVIDTIERHIESGQYAVHNLLSATKSKVSVVDKNADWYHEDIFINVNRKEDIDKVLSRNK